MSEGITPEWEAEMAERIDDLSDEMRADRMRKSSALNLIYRVTTLMTENTPLVPIEANELDRAHYSLGRLDQLAADYRELLSWAERIVDQGARP